MYIHSFFSAPLSSLIMNHLWLSSHDEYSETHSDNGYYLQVIPLYRSVLLSKCTSIHSSLHRCIPLLWVISDCLLMMSIQKYMKTPTCLLQVIPLYIRKLLSKCTSIHSSLHPCLPLSWIISDCLLMMSIRRDPQTTATTYKSFHCTELCCCLNVHPFVLLSPLSSLIMNHLWLSSHDEYSETHSDKGYYLQVIPLYRSVLLSKCTSIHSSLHRCLPLLWIISDCLLMMSIQKYMKTQTALLQVIPLYISKLLSKCKSFNSSLHPCLLLLWIISDCLLMMSIRRHPQTMATTYKSFHCTELCCCLNVHPFILLCTLVFPYYESSLIVFSWWVFRDTCRPKPNNYKSFHCT